MQAMEAIFSLKSIAHHHHLEEMIFLLKIKHTPSTIKLI